MEINTPITLDQLRQLIDERISLKLGGGRTIILKYNRQFNC